MLSKINSAQEELHKLEILHTRILYQATALYVA